MDEREGKPRTVLLGGRAVLALEELRLGTNFVGKWRQPENPVSPTSPTARGAGVGHNP